jgi:hypothetical protein
MFIAFRRNKCNDRRLYTEYTETELVNEKTFKQYGKFLVSDATKKDGSLFMLSSLEQFMINFKGVLYRTYKKNALWNNKSPWYSELLKLLPIVCEIGNDICICMYVHNLYVSIYTIYV